MPIMTPQKQKLLASFCGEYVTIKLVGDTLDV